MLIFIGVFLMLILGGILVLFLGLFSGGILRLIGVFIIFDGEKLNKNKNK
mgnify:CR=1 FL=1